MMDLFTAIESRRSVRKFQTGSEAQVPDAVITKALEAAVLAPNSSNTQTWDFYWAQSKEAKKKISHICLDQSAARTANHLVVVVADPGKWRRSQEPLIKFIESVQAPQPVQTYYRKLIPFVYRWGFLNCLAPIKFVLATAVALFRPMMRGPYSRGDIQTVAIKSAALAAQNFVLAITAQGYQSCMMEGFDENRLRRYLRLSSSANVVMVIAVGRQAENGLWGPRFRLPLSEVVHTIK